MSQEVVVEETFRVPAHVLYNTLLDSQQMTRLALGAPAQLDPHVGGKFYLFNKSIDGEVTGLEPYKEIREKWRFAEWDEYSDVVISLSKEDSETTRITVYHTNIPVKDKYVRGSEHPTIEAVPDETPEESNTQPGETDVPAGADGITAQTSGINVLSADDLAEEETGSATDSDWTSSDGLTDLVSALEEAEAAAAAGDTSSSGSAAPVDAPPTSEDSTGGLSAGDVAASGVTSPAAQPLGGEGQMSGTPPESSGQGSSAAVPSSSVGGSGARPKVRVRSQRLAARAKSKTAAVQRGPYFPSPPLFVQMLNVAAATESLLFLGLMIVRVAAEQLSLSGRRRLAHYLDSQLFSRRGPGSENDDDPAAEGASGDVSHARAPKRK